MSNREIIERAAQKICTLSQTALKGHCPALITIADIIESELEAAFGWKDIASAPKDGTRVLIVIEGVDRAVLATWDGSAWETIDGHIWTGRAVTHWQALPGVPEQEGE